MSKCISNGVFFALLNTTFFVAALFISTNTIHASGVLQRTTDGTATYLTTSPATGATASATSSAGLGRLFDPRLLDPAFFTDPGQLLTDLINIAFVVAVLLAFFYLIMAGFDWITSGGDKSKVEGARKKIISVIIGLILVAASYAILTLVLSFLGYENLQQVLNEARII
jgi:hypothetical protein